MRYKQRIVKGRSSLSAEPFTFEAVNYFEALSSVTRVASHVTGSQLASVGARHSGIVDVAHRIVGAHGVYPTIAGPVGMH
jgi:uncharacterized membrane protein